MLQINMADVMNVVGSLVPYLVVIGVLLVLAIIITFAVNKKTVKNVGSRKLIHSESWIVALVGHRRGHLHDAVRPAGHPAEQRDDHQVHAV